MATCSMWRCVILLGINAASPIWGLQFRQGQFRFAGPIGKLSSGMSSGRRRRAEKLDTVCVKPLAAPSNDLYILTATRGEQRSLPGLLLLGAQLSASNASSAITWVVVVDAESTSAKFDEMISSRRWFNLKHVKVMTETGKLGSRGAKQRNRGLLWAADIWKRRNRTDSMMYFADDDNIYRPALFDHLSRFDTSCDIAVWSSDSFSDNQYPLNKGATYVQNRETAPGFPCTESGKILNFGPERKTGRLFELDYSEFAMSMQLVLPKRSVTPVLLRSQWQSGRSENRWLHALLNVSIDTPTSSVFSHLHVIDGSCNRTTCLHPLASKAEHPGPPSNASRRRPSKPAPAGANSASKAPSQRHPPSASQKHPPRTKRQPPLKKQAQPERSQVAPKSTPGTPKTDWRSRYVDTFEIYQQKQSERGNSHMIAVTPTSSRR